MKNIEIFEKILMEVGAKYNLDTWYEIFDSEVFNEVENEICKYFNVTTSNQIKGYLDWVNDMCEEL